MKQYITPEVTVIEMEIEQSILDGSIPVNEINGTDEEHTL